MKPVELIKSRINPTKINDYIISVIEVDLKHINYGLDIERQYNKKQRSHFKIEEIISFFESLHLSEINSNEDENWEYFAINKTFYKNKKFRMVFCIDRLSPNISGVITFFEITRSKK